MFRSSISTFKVSKKGVRGGAVWFPFGVRRRSSQTSNLKTTRRMSFSKSKSMVPFGSTERTREPGMVFARRSKRNSRKWPKPAIQSKARCLFVVTIHRVLEVIDELGETYSELRS